MVNLYPIIDQSMATQEQAHAFHINKTALSLQNIDLPVQLDALGHQLNLSAMVEGVITDWLRYFYDRWCDFTQLQILSFHNTIGDEDNDTTDVTDSSILLPVIDGAYVTCHKNVKFVRIQLSVNFIDLVTIDNPGPTTLRSEYFIELPQMTCQLTNGAGSAYNLTTFHGTRTFVPSLLRKFRPRSSILPSKMDLSSFKPLALVPPAHERTPLPSARTSRRKFFDWQPHPSVR